MGGKTNGSKERGVGERVAKESGGETIVKAMGVRETGGKVSGGKATGAQVKQGDGRKSDRSMGERESLVTIYHQVTRLQDRMRWRGSIGRAILRQ